MVDADAPPPSDDPVALRRRVIDGLVRAGEIRAALSSVPAEHRDAWVDALLGLDDLPGDGPDLPPGCVPYLPCSVNTLVRALELAEVSNRDVFVDIGAGLGRTTILAHLLTGASAIGIEVQAGLVREARMLARRLGVSGVRTQHGDAPAMTRLMTTGTVFFLYCPFSGQRLQRVLHDLEELARRRPLRMCCVDLPLPAQSWLEEVGSTEGLVVYRSDGARAPS